MVIIAQDIKTVISYVLFVYRPTFSVIFCKIKINACGGGPTTPTLVGPNYFAFLWPKSYISKFWSDQSDCLVEVFPKWSDQSCSPSLTLEKGARFKEAQ